MRRAFDFIDGLALGVFATALMFCGALPPHPLWDRPNWMRAIFWWFVLVMGTWSMTVNARAWQKIRRDWRQWRDSRQEVDDG